MTGDTGASTTSQQTPAPAVTEAGPREVLAVRGMTKRWRGRTAPVLDAVDLGVRAGELVSLAGDNGTGKTTLLRVVAGLLDADGGEVRVDGLDPRSDRREYARRIGFVSAGNAGLLARLTARQHLAWAAAIAFVGREERAARIESVVEAFALAPLLASRTDRISMGQRQRVRLAMAFLGSPTLLLLDEPRTSLDAPALGLLGRALAGHLEAGGAALWCSPTGEAQGVRADRALVLRGAKVVPA